MNETAQHFTVEEANARLPLIKRILRDIVDLYQDVHERRRRLEEIRGGQSKPGQSSSVYREEVGEIEKELQRDIARLEGYTAELKQLNVLLKDPIKGVVMDDREIRLCWQLGEEEIAYWHDADAGFSDRQTLFEGSVPGSDSNEGE